MPSGSTGAPCTGTTGREPPEPPVGLRTAPATDTRDSGRQAREAHRPDRRRPLAVPAGGGASARPPISRVNDASGPHPVGPPEPSRA
ncbi:hypothetical protein CP969_27390 [Streptomyces viridosporus T7A]|uniref:Uncharacterized protein n=1 Tax=Streptomyces viridosporus T7A TaxID=665577 RepID=A0ABX6ALL8_STRVD|nr:hypothetical protein CP969_27390 [Streptomyces viridosporus T7A]